MSKSGLKLSLLRMDSGTHLFPHIGIVSSSGTSVDSISYAFCTIGWRGESVRRELSHFKCLGASSSQAASRSVHSR